MGLQQLLSFLTLLSLQSTATAFSGHRTSWPRTSSLSPSGNSQFLSSSAQSSRLLAASSSENNNAEEEEEEEDLISEEKLYNEIMGNDKHSKNKKQPSGKQKSIKKPHDNRDNLPFLVQVLTPPEQPYEQLVQKKVKKKKHKKKKHKRHLNDEDEDDTIVGETLGEFKFEKNTGSGDKIEIDDQIYLVTRAKCQYRYAGAQKFEMVRKILLVKPVQRAMQEEYILRQFNAPSAPREE